MQVRGFLNYCLKILLAERYLLYVNQTNLNGKLRKKLGGHGPPRSPLRIATVWSLAHMPLGLSDRIKMMLWPGCEGRVRCSLHKKKNVRSVRFVVKTRGCCCNLFAGVALNVRFTMKRMCANNNTIYMWREQAIIEWLRRMISIVACCHSVKPCAHASRAFWSQQMVLWPRCEGRARCRLHKKNALSVRLVMKTRGCFFVFFWCSGLLLVLYNYIGLVAPRLSLHNFWFVFVFWVCSLQPFRTLCAW